MKILNNLYILIAKNICIHLKKKNYIYFLKFVY